MADAQWIAPNGKILPVKINHITTILEKPSVFGLTRDYITKKFGEHGDRMGQEGKAREEIMFDLMKRGWIRVRYVVKKDSWTLQTYYYGKREQHNIWDWARESLSSKVISPHSGVTILIMKSGRVISSSALLAAKGDKIFEIKKKTKKKVS